MYVKLENEKVASVPRTSSLSVKGELTFDPSTQMLMLSLVLLFPFSPILFSPSFILTLSSFPFLPLSFCFFFALSCLSPPPVFYSSLPKDMRSLCCPRPTDTYHTIVIDCAAIVFVDSMGTSVLEQVAANLWVTPLAKDS